uniref:Uncharacterized protein n=1 Tax=Nephromyces sp. ex Molgula occidentalis TaxID=2544991 RepID=A0A5C1H865_9APIC|nr:hypothetical protein [Nephromyces sp. ex Molgula occidentalis]
MISIKNFNFKSDKQKYLKAGVLSYKDRKKLSLKKKWVKYLKLQFQYYKLTYSQFKHLWLHLNIGLQIQYYFLLINPFCLNLLLLSKQLTFNLEQLLLII